MAAVSKELKILLVIADEDDTIRLCDLLSGMSTPMFTIERAGDYSTGLQTLRCNHFDVCLFDYRLDNRKGLEFLDEAVRSGFKVPIIVLTSEGDYEADLQIMRAGAADCLSRNHLSLPLLERSIRYAIVCKEKEEVLRVHSEERYRSFFDNSLDGILITAPGGIIIAANPQACRSLERTQEDLCRVGVEAIVDTEHSSLSLVLEERARTGRYKGEVHFRRKDGTIFPVEIASALFHDRHMRERSVTIFRDISERKLMDEELRRSRDELECRVRERTAELEETNTALGVLLKRLEQEKRELMENLTVNIEELVLPYVQKLEESRLNEIQKTYVSQLRSSLTEIGSSFMRKLPQKHATLSPVEVRVAHLVKAGRENKEIAQILGVSLNTVITHRYHLRTKLGLKGRKVNLRSYLSTV